MSDDFIGELEQSLEWCPIDDHARGDRDVVVVRAGDRLAAAFYGDRTGWGSLTDAEREADKRECWRSAQESDDETPLEFEPTEFASLTPEQRAHLMAD